MSARGSVLLIDTNPESREVLAERLRMQGYAVNTVENPAEGALAALSNPPSAVIADLWMPAISGIQLCRLLHKEPATETVPVVLRGPDDQRNRFWAERAGAAAYVVRGRMGDLVRTLERVIAAAPAGSGFSIHLTGEATEIRDRIAAYLDAALFESVIAAEVRALSLSAEFARLFDLFSQFLSQVMAYRWMAVSTDAPRRFALHSHPGAREQAEREARAALDLPADLRATVVEDEDAMNAEAGPAPVVRPVHFVDVPLGRMAIAPVSEVPDQDLELLSVIARELGGPIRMASLVEEAQRLATVDPLTGLPNRRAFLASFEKEMERSRRLGYPLCVAMLDVDHFKSVNDQHGHAAGDEVLSSVGRLLAQEARKIDLPARWGGEEFIVALAGTDIEGAYIAAERMRKVLASTPVTVSPGKSISISASFGVARLEPGESADVVIDFADRAMYAAKTAGRNRVEKAARHNAAPPAAAPTEIAVGTKDDVRRPALPAGTPAVS